MPARSRCLKMSGLRHASCVVVTFANPEVALRILRSVRELRGDVPILVRTQDDTRLEELQSSGCNRSRAGDPRGQPHAAVAPAAVAEAAVARVIRTVNDIRSHRYGMLRQYFRGADAEFLDDSHAFREELHSVILPPHAWAVGRSIAELAEAARRRPSARYGVTESSAANRAPTRSSRRATWSWCAARPKPSSMPRRCS